MAELKTQNIVPLTELQRAPGRLVKRAIASKSPVVITQHGKPAAVLMDCETFERLESTTDKKNEYSATMGDRERKLRDELQRLLVEIVEHYHPDKVLLFGSLAGGNIQETSDIDLVVVKHDVPKRYWERVKEFSQLVEPHLGCDILIYSSDEWATALREDSRFIHDEIVGKGVVLYDRAA